MDQPNVELWDITLPSDRSKGGRKGRAPPWGPNSFNFMQFLGKYGNINVAAPLGSWRPLLEENPPLTAQKIKKTENY